MIPEGTNNTGTKFLLDRRIVEVPTRSRPVDQPEIFHLKATVISKLAFVPDLVPVPVPPVIES